MFNKLIPKIFFERLEQGLDLFVTGLAFQVRYQDDDLAVVERDGAKAYLVQAVTLRPWGAREFAVRDSTDVCVIFRQWPAGNS